MKIGQSSKKGRRGQQRSRVPAKELDNLVTTEEMRMMEPEDAVSSSQIRNMNRNNEAFCMQEEEEMVVSVDKIKEVNAQKMSIMVSQLLAKNKINAKNAFQVPLIHLNETCAFSEISTDSSWKRLSSTLESNNKIYGYRVDAAHSYTYRVLESITRQERQDNQEKQEETSYRRERAELNSLNSQFVCNEIEENYAKYLEKNYRNINIIQLDTFFNVNPMLEKTKRIFDQNGLSALLLNHLDTRADLSLTINLLHDVKPPQLQKNADQNSILCQLDCNSSLEGYNIFRKIEDICIINNLIEQEEEEFSVKRETGQIQAMWMEFEQGLVRRHNKRAIKIEQQHGESVAIIITQNENPKSSSPHASYIKTQAEITEEHQPIHQQNNQQTIQPHDLIPPHDLPVQGLQDSKETPMSMPESLSTLKDPLHQPSADSQKNSLQSEIPGAQKANLPNNSLISDEPSSVRPEGSFIQISKYIKVGKSCQSTDLILRQIADMGTEEVEKSDLVSKWKNNESVPKKQRKPRVKEAPINNEIDFLCGKDGITNRKRKAVLNLDKKSKKQFKGLLKDLHLQAYRDRNCVINTNYWKIDFQLKTFISKYFVSAGNKDCLEQGSNQQGSVLIIDIDHEDECKWAMRNLKSTSIRQAKEIIKHLIQNYHENQISFGEIYQKLVDNENGISPALCFLTVLHLTNEHSYNLTQVEGEFSFIIRRQ